MTSATEILRRLLDERGVEWEAWNACITVVPPSTHYLEVSNGTLCVAIVDATTQQAIDATLGRGTCHAVFEVDTMTEDERVGEYVCSECGETFGDGRDHLPNYCPNCGRRVVE